MPQKIPMKHFSQIKISAGMYSRNLYFIIYNFQSNSVQLLYATEIGLKKVCQSSNYKLKENKIKKYHNSNCLIMLYTS